MSALKLQRFIDRRQDSIGCMCSPGDVSVRQDGEELRRGAAQDSWGVDVAHSPSQSCCHRFEGFLGWAAAIRLDQENAKVSLVSMGPGQLVLQDRTYKPLVEQARGAVDDVEWLRLGIVSPDPARRAEDSTMG
jgi:hypothetical protein